MSSKFDVEFNSLIKVYEANDNIEPGSSSEFANTLGGLIGRAYGAVNYMLNFKKFYNNTLKKAKEINDEYLYLRSMGDSIDKGAIKRRSRLQFTINDLKESINKWKQYLAPLNSKSARKSKAALEVIESILQRAETGTLSKKRSQPLPSPQKTATTP